jgi:hypothetical protein
MCKNLGTTQQWEQDLYSFCCLSRIWQLLNSAICLPLHLQCGAPKQLTLVYCPLSYWCFVFKYQLSYPVGHEHGCNAQTRSTGCLTACFFHCRERGQRALEQRLAEKLAAIKSSEVTPLHEDASTEVWGIPPVFAAGAALSWRFFYGLVNWCIKSHVFFSFAHSHAIALCSQPYLAIFSTGLLVIL